MPLSPSQSLVLRRNLFFPPTQFKLKVLTPKLAIHDGLMPRIAKFGGCMATTLALIPRENKDHPWLIAVALWHFGRIDCKSWRLSMRLYGYGTPTALLFPGLINDKDHPWLLGGGGCMAATPALIPRVINY